MSNRYARNILVLLGAAVLLIGGGVLFWARGGRDLLAGAVRTAAAQEADADTTDTPLHERGLLVTAVDPDGAAAGLLRRGQIILAVNGTDVDDISALFDALEAVGGGNSATLTVLHGDETRSVEVTLAAEQPYLGIGLSGADGRHGMISITPDFRPHDSLFVTPGQLPAAIGEVIADSPAAAAGLTNGDVISAIDGAAVETPADVVTAIQAHAPGDTVSLTVERGDETLTLEATLAAHPEDAERAYLGVRFARMFELHSTGRVPFLHGDVLTDTVGAVVGDVVADGPAAAAGLQAGDVITEVNGTAIPDGVTLVKLLADLAPGDMVTVTYERDGAAATVEMTLAAHPDDAERAFLGIMLLNNLKIVVDGTQGGVPFEHEFEFGLPGDFVPGVPFEHEFERELELEAGGLDA